MPDTALSLTVSSVTVNGVPQSAAGVPPHTTLLTWLRERGLTACKEGCAEGECGACAVLVAREDAAAAGEGAGTRWVSLNACLLTLAALSGQEVVTAEGLGQPGHLHPVQRELAAHGGSQCGYCTPGFVSSFAAEYYRPERGSAPLDPHALSGNLCRCTGYRSIRDAASALGPPEAGDPLAERCAQPAPPPQPVRVSAPGGTFTRPATLDEALSLYAEQPEAVLLAGGTDWNVEVNLRHARAEHVIAVGALPELTELRRTPDALFIGAALPLSELERRLGDTVPLLAQLWPQFASPLIRGAATLGGNLGTASPVGDSAPALLALDASVLLVSVDGEREVPLAEYFTGYRQTVRRPGELIRAVRVPLPAAPISAFYKVSKRRADDISSVAVAFALEVRDGTVTHARIGLGGVAATPLRARATEAALTGQPWTEATARHAGQVLRGEGTPLSDHRASAEYRAAMLEQAPLRLLADWPAERLEARA